MTKQTADNNYLFWVDMEFTGFDPVFDPILELYLIVTNSQLDVVEEYGAVIWNDAGILRQQMSENPFWKEHAEQRNYFLDACPTGRQIEDVDRELNEIIKKYTTEGDAILAGNSIRSDRTMIDAQMPLFSSMLHYRMLDVTSFKIVMEARGVVYEKKESHRAKDDIIESIEELKFYLDRFSLNNIL